MPAARQTIADCHMRSHRRPSVPFRLSTTEMEREPHWRLAKVALPAASLVETTELLEPAAVLPRPIPNPAPHYWLAMRSQPTTKRLAELVRPVLPGQLLLLRYLGPAMST